MKSRGPRPSRPATYWVSIRYAVRSRSLSVAMVRSPGGLSITTISSSSYTRRSAAGKGGGGGAPNSTRSSALTSSSPRRTTSPLTRTRPSASHCLRPRREDRKSTRLNSSHVKISYAVFCLKNKKKKKNNIYLKKKKKKKKQKKK